MARLADADGKITSWHFVNINSGRTGIETPYRVAGKAGRSSIRPVRAAAASRLLPRPGRHREHFARECFMDELARAAPARTRWSSASRTSRTNPASATS